MDNRTEQKKTTEGRLLISYLEQYRRCRFKLRTLERRRRDIIQDFDASALSAFNFDGMPKAVGNVSIGAASMAMRLDEIDTRIREQKNEVARKVLAIMDILDFLPRMCPEREVLEARYIDCYSWTKTCLEIGMTRTPANKYLRKGVQMLLEFKKVQRILSDYEKELKEME